MRFKKAIIAALAVSMTASPVLAQSAAPLSVASSVSRIGAATGDASSLRRDGYLIPGLVIAVILAAAILWTSNKDTELDNPSIPRSP